MSALENTWDVAARTALPSRDEAHVWRVNIDHLRSRETEYARLLSTDEQVRASRFHQATDASRFACCRGWLRTLLGNCLDRPPATLRFSYSPNGRPLLENASGGPVIFNLAHSGSVALAVISGGVDAGVDVECIQPGLVDETTAVRMFALSEQREFLRRDETGRARYFFQTWTRREAWLKGIGVGLASDVFAGMEIPAEWNVVNLPMEEDYAGAIAVKAHNIRLRCCEWRSA